MNKPQQDAAISAAEQSDPFGKTDPNDSPSSNLAEETLRIALIGNPNTGKSTLFNRLTGVHQHTANYPRVTFEHHIGYFSIDQQKVELIDLPGTYSLTPRSPDELIPFELLLEQSQHPVDIILCVLDGNNLDRNLFLVSQVLELRRPVVIAVNMLDVATRHGKEVDLDQLSQVLGVPVVGIQANRGSGLDRLKETLMRTRQSPPTHAHQPFPAEVDQVLDQLSYEVNQCKGQPDPSSRFLAARLLFDADGFVLPLFSAEAQAQLRDELTAARQKIVSSDLSLPQQESEFRYQWIQDRLSSFVHQKDHSDQATSTERLDYWLTHPLWGLLVALVVMVIVFQSVFMIAEPASAGIEMIQAWLGSGVDALIPEGALNSLINDGLIAGVGAVLVFLPQILLLFFILAILEDTGYLARAAYLMDRFMARIGLSGIALFPLLSSFACAIPGIMSARVIPDRRERMITILVAPLMSCSARLPVYIIMIAVFVPDYRYLWGWLGLHGLVMMAMYLVGVVVAVGVAWILKRTLFKGGASTFVIELPTYKMPNLANVVQRMFDGGWAFVRDAGTIIVAVTILVWAASYYPRSADLPAEWLAQQEELQAMIDQLPEDADEETMEELQQQLEGIESAYQLRQSFLGRAGRAIEPLVIPLGWDWRIGSAAIASFPAREVVVATMGVIFAQGDDVDEESPGLRQALANATWEGSDRKLFTLPVALSLMVFFALCAQCVSTLAVMKRETGSWWWPVFTFCYMTILAYVAALVVFQVSNPWWG